MKNYVYLGDNKIVLSKKMPQLENKIDIVYIDPPYNTNSRKSYKDSEYTNESWKDMMEPRIILGRKILNERGVMFISIDDNQSASLKTLCDDVFGQKNFLGVFITKQSQRSNSKHINTIHEYIFAYAKDKSKTPKFESNRIDDLIEGPMIKAITKKVKTVFKQSGLEPAKKELKNLIKNYCDKLNISWLKNYNRIDDNGRVFFGIDLSTPGKPRKVEIPEINLFLNPLPTRGWSSDEKFISLANNKRLYYRGDRPYEISYLEEAKDSVSSILDFYSRQGTNDLNKLGLRDLFDTPKPVDLIKYLINIYPGDSLVVCDYFAGSGTTAQAVIEINKESNKGHRFILVQSEEGLSPDSTPFEQAKKLNLDATVSSIMLHRIKTVLGVTDFEDTNIEIERIDDND